MVIILIRRCVRPDKIADFLASYEKDSPKDKKGFRRETLTRVNDATELPEALRSYKIVEADCVTFLNVAEWDSWEDFEAAFHPSPGFCDESIETSPRVRAVLDAVGGH
jgi:hypothetical protein